MRTCRFRFRAIAMLVYSTESALKKVYYQIIFNPVTNQLRGNESRSQSGISPPPTAPEGLPPRSQEPATGPHSEPDESNPDLSAPSPQDPFQPSSHPRPGPPDCSLVNTGTKGQKLRAL